MTTLNEELRTLLNQVCEGRQANSQVTLVKLEDCLEVNKDILINLLQDKPKKPEDRTTLISGKALIEGKEHRVNEDFVKQCIFLSDHLNINEFTAARLLLAGISQASLTNSTPLDTAVYLYHNERGYILAILNTILEAAKDYSNEESVRNIFTKFITLLVTEKSSSTGSFIKRAIQSTKDISTMINTLTKQGMLDSAKDCKQQLLTQLTPQYPQQAQDGSLQASIQNLNFGPNTTELRLEKLNDESIFLAQIIYHIASLFWLDEDDLMEILTKVQSINLSDASASYILTALLAALSFDNGYTRQGTNFTENDSILNKFHEQITKKVWKVDSVEAVVHIQWALLITSIKANRPTCTLNINTEELVKAAIAADAFGFMNDYLLYFKQKDGEIGEEKKGAVVNGDSAMEIDGLIVDPNDYRKFNVDINPDFRKFVVHELELLTQSFIYNMSPIFKNVHTKAEAQPAEVSEEVHNTIVKFLTLMASIYRDRINVGTKFWNEQNTQLYDFMVFLIKCRLIQCYASIFDFLGTISTGIESANYAHSKLKSGTSRIDIQNSNFFSWGKLFSTLQFYNKEFEKVKSEDSEPPNMLPREEEVLCHYLYLCQQVVQYSKTARIEIWSDSLLLAHQSIVQMISAPTSTRLRASLYDLLAAFCSNWGGGIDGVGKGIALEVWGTLEHSDMVIPKKTMVNQPTEAVKATPIIKPTENTLFSGLNYPPPAAAAKTPAPQALSKRQQQFLPEQPSGFLREFEEEKASQSYIETHSVLNLFASMIHTPSKRDELISGYSLIQPSIPHLLGSDNNRTPGTAPYMSFIIDHVFLSLKNLRYHSRKTRWQLTDVCLATIENSINSFNIDPLVDYIGYINKDTALAVNNYILAFTGRNTPAVATETTTASSAKVLQVALLAVVTQPGYDILVRILSGSGLVHEMFQIVEKGKEGIYKSINKHKHIYYKECMERCLRIFSRVFSIQNAFVNVIIPQLDKIAGKETSGRFKLGEYIFPSPPPSLRSLANLMSNNTKVIEQIALMVNCDEYEDICKLSISVLSQLASPPQNDAVKFPNHVNIPMGGIGSSLAGILLSSPNASSVIFSFKERLEIESAEVLTYDDFEYDMNVIPFWLAENTLSDIYRLEKKDQTCPDISVRLTILDMLLRNMENDVKSPTITEFILGYDVNELEATGVQQKSIPTDVQHKQQLACLLSILDMVNKGTRPQHAEYADEETLVRSHPVLAEKCYQLIFKLCAREPTSNATLHYLRNNTDDFLAEQFKSIAYRLESCVGSFQPCLRATLISADNKPVSTDYFTTVSCLHQRAWLLKLIALELHVNSTDRSSISALLQLLYGCPDDVVPESDHDKLEELKIRLDSNDQQSLWNMLEIVNSLEFHWLEDTLVDTLKEFQYITAFDADQYTIQKDGYKIYDIRTIWKVLRQYEFTNPTCVSLPDSERMAMELEMRDILARSMAENRRREISYARLHCLRAWKQVIQITICDRFDLLSFEAREKIIYDLLSVILPKLESDNNFIPEILNGLADVALSLLIRLKEDKCKQSILRAATPSESRLPQERLILMFISIVNCICKPESTVEVRSAMYTALVNLLDYSKPVGIVAQDDIHAQLITVMGTERIENLLTIVCTDAGKGVAMNKSTAFMALEALYLLIVQANSGIVHSYLVKKNFLQNVIGSIHRSDSDLCKVIEERDASLVALYNHEAKISLFMQIASRAEGAALLLSNDLLSSISDCKFINVRFERNQIEDPDTAYKIERHGRILTPILELVNTVLVSIGSQVADQYAFISWIKRQQAIVHILKDENTKTTLSALYILHLTTSILYQLSCQTHYFDDVENNGMKELDALMVKLIPKYCLSRDWATAIQPVSPEEISLSVVPDTVGGHISLLASRAEKHITNIRKNLLAYARNSTFRAYQPGKRSFKPVVANTLVSMKDQPITLSRVSLMTPSLTTLVSCLADTGKKLSKAHADHLLLASQKDNVASLKYEEIQEIAATATPKGLGIKFESLNASQQSHLLETEINHRMSLKHKEINDLVFILEHVLLILWRHLAFYLDRKSISIKTTLSPCERQADEQVVLQHQLLYQTNTSLIAKLTAACEKELDPVLEKLETVLKTTSRPLMVLTKIRNCYK